MCKKTQFKYCPSTIDKCMRDYVKMINKILLPIYETKSCCCGHGKYPRTLMIGLKKGSFVFDLFTATIIKREKKFYKKDKEGYYYIPEISKALLRSKVQDKTKCNYGFRKKKHWPREEEK